MVLSSHFYLLCFGIGTGRASIGWTDGHDITPVSPSQVSTLTPLPCHTLLLSICVLCVIRREDVHQIRACEMKRSRNKFTVLSERSTIFFLWEALLVLQHMGAPFALSNIHIFEKENGFHKLSGQIRLNTLNWQIKVYWAMRYSWKTEEWKCGWWRNSYRNPLVSQWQSPCFFFSLVGWVNCILEM